MRALYLTIRHVLRVHELLNEIGENPSGTAVEMEAIDVESPTTLLSDLVKVLMKYEDLESGLALG